MALRRRLVDYNQKLKEALEQGDPLDSQFFQGFDQAIRNVTWALDRILAQEDIAKMWVRDRIEAVGGMLEEEAKIEQDAWGRGYDAAMDSYLEDLEEFLEMLEGEKQ